MQSGEWPPVALWADSDQRESSTSVDLRFGSPRGLMESLWTSGFALLGG